MFLDLGVMKRMVAGRNGYKKKSSFTGYRSNRFNNIFENAVAVLHHRAEALHFLQDCASNSNLKLRSICYDLHDLRILSIITAIALLSTYLTTPYWALMNSNTPYGKFPAHVRSMNMALQRWSSPDFDISLLPTEEPIFGKDFVNASNVAFSFLTSQFCDKALATTSFKSICSQSMKVVQRQLHDFLPGGIYGDILPLDVQEFLNTCPLTNLTGERMFGDLDYDMGRRRNASTYLRSTVNMWKHNQPSKFLDSKTTNAFKKTMAAGRKHGKELKKKHDRAIKAVREKVKAKIAENERNKKEKENQDKERQAHLLNDILSQGGLCSTKEELEKLKNGPNALQNLKAQIRFRKYYKDAKELRLTGNFKTLYNSLCSHLGIDYDEIPEPPRKRRKTTMAVREEDSESNETCDEEEDSESNEACDEEDSQLGD